MQLPAVASEGYSPHILRTSDFTHHKKLLLFVTWLPRFPDVCCWTTNWSVELQVRVVAVTTERKQTVSESGGEIKGTTSDNFCHTHFLLLTKSWPLLVLPFICLSLSLPLPPFCHFDTRVTSTPLSLSSPSLSLPPPSSLEDDTLKHTHNDPCLINNQQRVWE